MINFENAIKGPLTSLLGFGVLCAAGYGWWVEHLTDMQAGSFGLIGFMLLFMRDALPGFITRWFNKKIDDKSGSPPTAVLILALSSLTIFAHGQSTDAALKTQADVIRNETVANANSKTRVANMFQALIDSKVNRAELLIATGTNSYAVTANTTITSYANKIQLLVLFTNSNTGAATLNVNGIGPIAIKKNVSTALISGDIAAGQVLQVVYDGTNFQIIGGLGSGGGAWGTITGTLTSQSDLNTALNTKLIKSNNLSDLTDASAARTNLGLGSLATQSGTFSGTHSGTSSGSNTGDQINITGNAATVTTNANLTGAISSTGNTTTLNSFSSGDLSTALTDEVGSGNALFSDLLYNDQAGDYTFQSTDKGLIVNMNKATSSTLTFPPNASVPFTNGTTLYFKRTATSSTPLITFAAGAGVTLVTSSGTATEPDNGKNYLMSATQGPINTWTIQNGSPSNAVPLSRTLANLDLTVNRTASEINVALISFPYVSGRLYGTSNNYTAKSTGALTSNSIRAQPFIVKKTMVIDALVTEVTTVGAFNFRMAIYLDDGDGIPNAADNLIAQTEQDGSTPAAPSLRTGSVSATLSPGLYWLCIVTAGSITFRVDSNGGWPDYLGYDASSQATIRQPYYSVAFTYGSFPSTFPAGAAINTNAGGGTNAPIVWVRKS